MRLNVSPKMTSHSTGCTARVKSSVRSCESFCSSTRQNVPTRFGKRRQTCGAPRSAEPARGTTSASDRTQASSQVAVEAAAGVVAEDIFERRVRSERRLQLVGRSLRPDRAEVHEGDAVAERIRLLHVVH